MRHCSPRRNRWPRRRIATTSRSGSTISRRGWRGDGLRLAADCGESPIPTFGGHQVSEIDVEMIEGLIAALKRGAAPAPPAPESRDRRRKPRDPKKLSNRRVTSSSRSCGNRSTGLWPRDGSQTTRRAGSIFFARRTPEIDPLSLTEVKTFLGSGLDDEDWRRYFASHSSPDSGPARRLAFNGTTLTGSERSSASGVRSAASARDQPRPLNQSGMSECCPSSSKRSAPAGPPANYEARGYSPTAPAARSISPTSVSAYGVPLSDRQSCAPAPSTRRGIPSPR